MARGDAAAEWGGDTLTGTSGFIFFFLVFFPPALAVTALLFKMEEANLASRAKAQELIQATNQVGTRGARWGGGAAFGAAAGTHARPPPTMGVILGGSTQPWSGRSPP